jgi:hypothetical protein
MLHLRGTFVQVDGEHTQRQEEGLSVRPSISVAHIRGAITELSVGYGLVLKITINWKHNLIFENLFSRSVVPIYLRPKLTHTEIQVRS